MANTHLKPQEHKNYNEFVSALNTFYDEYFLSAAYNVSPAIFFCN